MACRISGYLIILLLLSVNVHAQEVVTDFENKSLPVLNDELRKINNSIRGLQDIHTFKAHKTAAVTFLSADTWQDIEWDTKIDEESVGVIDYRNVDTISEDASIIAIRGITDILGIQGCARPKWTGAAGTSVVVATRILYSEDNGASWTEARCLQAVQTYSRAVDAADTVPYHGTVSTSGNTLIKLQVLSSSTDMTLDGYTGFDNPVAASIEIRNLGTRS